MALARKILLTFLALALASFLRGANSGVSMSTVDMENLLSAEQFLIDNMERFAEAVEEKLNFVKRNLKRMKEENERALREPEAYVSNPLVAFSLIRRCEEDWTLWELFMKKEVGKEFIEEIRNLRLNLPNHDDVVEAVNGIDRLQDTYNFSPEKMSTGNLSGFRYNVDLSAMDCFAIGMVLYKNQKYYPAALWFYSSLNRISSDSSDFHEALGFQEINIWYFYALSNMKLGNFKVALIIVNQGLETDPSNPELIRLKNNLDIKINQMADLEKPPENVWEEKSHDQQEYERGCRGEYPIRSKLHCRYNRTTNAFLKLAPLKMEEISLDPYMILYHDVISEAEIAALKILARPKLKRAAVYYETTNSEKIDETRTGKIAWLADDEDDVTIRINQRVEDMTGFDLSGSEELQVANYGIGGHFKTHYDSFNLPRDHDVVKMNGDRIATVMFYLSDVEKGGATVFPRIETAMKPHKGSALLWYNLDQRGNLNNKSLHGACPVLVGSKWICNKWIREKAQAFIKPCF